MKKLLLLLIPIPILFSAAIPDNVPCGKTSFFRVSYCDLPGFNCCLSDSFRIEKKEMYRDTFMEQCKGEFLYFDMYSAESNSNQLIYVLVKDKVNGKTVESRLTCENSSTSFSALIFLKKLHKRAVHASDFSITVIKIINEGKDTLRCNAGNIHLNYMER